MWHECKLFMLISRSLRVFLITLHVCGHRHRHGTAHVVTTMCTTLNFTTPPPHTHLLSVMLSDVHPYLFIQLQQQVKNYEQLKKEWFREKTLVSGHAYLVASNANAPTSSSIAAYTVNPKIYRTVKRGNYHPVG